MLSAMEPSVPSPVFALVGAGLPRTGTLSTRSALSVLLEGSCYHMACVVGSTADHAHWGRAILGQTEEEDWHQVLGRQGYRAGVDYPVSLFYQEILAAYPDAKVLLNVRDPVKWFHSVKNSIYKLNRTATSFPCSLFLRLTNSYDGVELAKQISEAVPRGSSLGLGMFGAIEAGEETALQFWNDHVEEVKRVVPDDKLLIWEVKEGWGPLCKFLDVSTPSIPFPNVNDTSQIEDSRNKLLLSSWLVVILLPLLAILGMVLLDCSVYFALVLTFGIGIFVCFKSRDVSHMKQK